MTVSEHLLSAELGSVSRTQRTFLMADSGKMLEPWVTSGEQACPVWCHSPLIALPEGDHPSFLRHPCPHTQSTWCLLVPCFSHEPVLFPKSMKPTVRKGPWGHPGQSPHAVNEAAQPALIEELAGLEAMKRFLRPFP